LIYAIDTSVSSKSIAVAQIRIGATITIICIAYASQIRKLAVNVGFVEGAF
jgi:hypothetical protein